MDTFAGSMTFARRQLLPAGAQSCGGQQCIAVRRAVFIRPGRQHRARAGIEDVERDAIAFIARQRWPAVPTQRGPACETGFREDPLIRLLDEVSG